MFEKDNFMENECSRCIAEWCPSGTTDPCQDSSSILLNLKKSKQIPLNQLRQSNKQLLKPPKEIYN